MELADELGFHSAWVSEHHFLEEYAHFSTPELLLAAASQRTSRIRLGHGIVTMPPLVNPPIRVAERIGALDVLSNGSVEFGFGESLGTRELGGFGVDLENKSQQWDEALQAVVGMLEQDCYEGFSGDVVLVLGRPVYPKPIQKPTPPLWVACSRTEGLAKPAHKGAGALCLTPTQGLPLVIPAY